MTVLNWLLGNRDFWNLVTYLRVWWLHDKQFWEILQEKPPMTTTLTGLEKALKPSPVLMRDVLHEAVPIPTFRPQPGETTIAFKTVNAIVDGKDMHTTVFDFISHEGWTRYEGELRLVDNEVWK